LCTARCVVARTFFLSRLLRPPLLPRLESPLTRRFQIIHPQLSLTFLLFHSLTHSLLDYTGAGASTTDYPHFNCRFHVFGLEGALLGRDHQCPAEGLHQEVRRE
jgi:hypothetical protein